MTLTLYQKKFNKYDTYQLGQLLSKLRGSLFFIYYLSIFLAKKKLFQIQTNDDAGTLKSVSPTVSNPDTHHRSVKHFK